MKRLLVFTLALVLLLAPSTFAKKQKPPQLVPPAGAKVSGAKIPPGHMKVHGNNGLGNGIDPQPPGNPPVNDGPGRFPGNPGNKGRGKR